jgi:hypothetical protein
MRSARLLVALVLGLTVGIALGWYFGYIQPVTRANRDARQYMDSTEQDDRMTVAVALAAIRQLEEKRLPEAEQLLARSLASYYVTYGPPGHPKKRISEDRLKVLRRIEEAAQRNPAVQAAIERSKENVTK